MADRDDRYELETGAHMPPRAREDLVNEVRRRLEAGELDSDLALVETAFALLDGDPSRPRSAPR